MPIRELSRSSSHKHFVSFIPIVMTLDSQRGYVGQSKFLDEVFPNVTRVLLKVNFSLNILPHYPVSILESQNSMLQTEVFPCTIAERNSSILCCRVAISARCNQISSMKFPYVQHAGRRHFSRQVTSCYSTLL